MQLQIAPKKLITQLLIVLGGCVLFLPGLGSVHLFDWDEINFAESAREMLLTQDYLTVQVNFEPFWEKPPLFIWMQALSMHLFGVNEFAARFPNAICGIVTLLVLFNCGYRLRSYRFGVIWALLYGSSLFPFFFFKTGIIDPWFNLFIFSGIYWFVRFTEPEQRGNRTLQAALSALFLGLAILTKGPVGLLIFLLTFGIYLLFNLFRLDFKWSQVLLFVVVLATVGGFWFILQIASGNFTIIQDFIVYQIRLFQTQDAGHGGFLLYHFVMVLIGVFPASILALPTFHRSVLSGERDRNTAHWFRWMMILFWVVLILFTIVRTKIVHYASMSYFPLTFLAAWQVERWLDGKARIQWWQKALLLTLAIVAGIAVALLPYFDQLKGYILPYVDEFSAGLLAATSQWHGFEGIIGLVLIAATLLFAIWANRYELRSFVLLAVGALFFVALTMVFVVPEVEKYSQASLIEFVESRRGEDCYIYPLHKSYAPYFYGERRPQNRLDDYDVLTTAALDRPCYFILRDTQEEQQTFLGEVPDAEKLYAKTGFAFYVRQPKKTTD